MIRWSQREFKLHVIIIIIITCQKSGNARKTIEWQKYIPDIKNERQKGENPFVLTSIHLPVNDTVRCSALQFEVWMKDMLRL